MKDNIKYPERIYANFKSTAGGDVYGGYTNRPLLASDPFDNELYVRADIVKDEIDTLTVEKESLKQLLVNMKNARPQWHDASKELPSEGAYVLCACGTKGNSFHIMQRERYESRDYWYTMDNISYSPVVAWMPLPEPFNPDQTK